MRADRHSTAKPWCSTSLANLFSGDLVKKFIAALKATLFRLRFQLLLGVLILLVAMGGAYGWRTYQYRQTPEFALENINKYVLSGKRTELATLVDFRALALDLAENIYKQRPDTALLGPASQKTASMADAIQMRLFTELEPPKDVKPAPKLPLEAPLAPLPTDFFAQIAGKFVIQTTRENMALIRAVVDYPRVQQPFPVVLLMERKGGGWRVTRLANADDLVARFVQAEAKLQEQRQQALEEKNASELSRMKAQLDITSCTVAAATLSDRKTVLLTIQVMGRNKGPHTIHNMNLIATLTGSAQSGLAMQRHVNIAARMPPGENLSHTYNAELDMDNPEDAALLKAGKLQCTASPRAMTLSSGEVLYLREKPAP